MPNHCNLHTHTHFSDGQNAPEEMIQAALNRGFVSLGFSDHGFARYDTCSIPREREPLYRAEIRALKEQYKGQIEIALGYEHDAKTYDNDLNGYDYIIESIHSIYHDGEYLSVDHSPARLEYAANVHFGGDYYALCKAYYEAICESIENAVGQIVGHIDLVTKFNERGGYFDASDPRFLNPAIEAVRFAAEKDMIVEINTGAMSRGYRTAPYPAPALLKELKSLGGRITISSDCHRAEWLDFAFDQAAGIARSCGFTENWIWKNGGLAPVEL